jgi:hypothetical protein
MIAKIIIIVDKANEITFAKDKTNTLIIETFLIIKLRLSL